MTWTFDPALSTDRDYVRLLIGDTDTADQELADETVAALLTAQGSVLSAAEAACRALAAKYARAVRTRLGQSDVDEGAKHDHYLALSKTLRSQLAIAAAPWAGGISIADKLTNETDTDRVEPAFTRRLHEVPGSPGSGNPWDGRLGV